MRGLPIVLYGTEQQATGYVHDNTNRSPMWTYGFDMASPFFTWIRMLNWCGSPLVPQCRGICFPSLFMYNSLIIFSPLHRYRYVLHMWDDAASEYRELYVDDYVFVWQRGPNSLFVVKSGMGNQSSIPLNASAILPGTNACLMEQNDVGVRG